MSYLIFFLMIRRPLSSPLDRWSAASDVYKGQSVLRVEERVDLPGVARPRDARELVHLVAHVIDAQAAREDVGEGVPRGGRDASHARGEANAAALGDGCLLCPYPIPRDPTTSRTHFSAFTQAHASL